MRRRSRRARNTACKKLPKRFRALGPEKLERRDLLAVQSLTGFEPLEPTGSWIYSTDVSSSVSASDTTQQFEVALDAGQTLSVSAQGAFQANLQVLDTTNAPVVDTTSSTVGAPVTANSIPVDVAGVYTIIVSAADGGTGAFNLSAMLNASFEGETTGGLANDSAVSAEDLETSFSPVGPLGAERSAVVGEVSDVEATYSDSATIFGRAFFPNLLSFDFIGVPTPDGDLVMNVEAETDLNETSEILVLDTEGLFAQDLFVTGGSQGGISTTQVTIPQAIAAQLAADGTISMTLKPSPTVQSAFGSGDVTVSFEYRTDGGPDLEDWHRLSLDDGQAASIAVYGDVAQVDLYASDGTTLLATANPTAEVAGQIDGFADATTDGAADDYFVRISGGTAQYHLVVVKGGSLSLETGSTATPRDLRSGEAVLEFLRPEIELDTPISGGLNVGGVPLSVGFAIDGSFSGPSVGIAHDGVEIINLGSFVAGYSVAFNGASHTNVRPETFGTSFPVSMYDVSSVNSSDHAYLIMGEVEPGVAFERFVQWSDGDDFIHITTRLTNNSDNDLTGVAFLESFDPDVPSNSTTSNDVTLGGTLVTATAGSKSIGLGSNDPDVVVSAESFRVSDPFTIINSPVDPNGGSGDVAINLAFDLGALPVGESVSRNHQVVIGSSPIEVGAIFAATGDPPILGFSNVANELTFSAISGDTIQIESYTPAAGPFDFVNLLDVGIEVVAPDGVPVPHVNVPGDEALTFVAQQTGSYTIRSLAENSTQGEVALRVSGSTAPLAPFTVESSSVLEGQRFLPDTLTNLTIDLSADLRLSSLSATDLLIGGVPTATGVSIVDSDTVTFALPSLPHGAHTLQLPAGSLTDLSGKPLEVFSVDVVVDEFGPRILGSTILEGEVFAPGANTFEFTFDEPLNESISLARGGVSLIGTRTGAQPISDVAFDPDTLTLAVTTSDLPEDSFELRLDDAWFVDTLGLQLDGERDPETTVPTGDGVAGGDFVVNFAIDTVTAPLAEFAPRGPRGGLIYEANVSGYIGPAGDIDAFTIDLDAGQAISLVVDGELRASVELFDPNDVSLGVAAASVAGEYAILQSIPVTDGGTYRVEITGGSGTTGAFNLWTLLNAQPELEELAGADNSDAAAAEPLDFTPLDTSGADVALSDHAAVTGFVSIVGPTYTASLTEFGRAFHPNVLAFDFNSTPHPVGDLLMTVQAVADLDSTGEFLTLNAEGLFSQNLFVFGGSQGGLSTTQLSIPQSIVSQLAADGTISITLTPSSGVNSGFGSGDVTVTIDYPTTGVLGDDWYSLGLQDGEAATIALAGPGITAELYAPDGTTLLAAGEPTEDGTWVIENFVDNTSDGAVDDYLVRVVAGIGEYDLVVTRNAAFDREGNDSFDAAQDVSGLAGVLGAAVGPYETDGEGDDDWFIVSLNAGDNLNAEVSLPGGGPGEFQNLLGAGIPGGLIISEVVDGAAGDGNPKFVELTNTTSTPFTFVAGGLIVQTNTSTDRNVDIDLTGVTIASGDSYVIASSLNDGRAAFEDVYGVAADLYADELIGDGNDRYALSDSDDGSSILDVYGELGIDGTGTAWEYADGYAYRSPSSIVGRNLGFHIGQWFVSGPGALVDDLLSSEELLLAHTTPGVHDFVAANSPLARIALFDPNGQEVMPGDTSLQFSATEAGEYRLRLSSFVLSGEYYVSIDGATGQNLAPAIVGASIAEGELLKALPATLELTFSEALQAGEVQASDLLINGVVGASSVSQIDPVTFVFEIDPAASSGDGDHAFTLPAGAVVDLQGVANLDYALNIVIDGTSPIVTEALIDGAPLPLGVTYPSGDRSLSVLFNEPIDEAGIENGSFQLIETISNTTIAADAFAYDSASQTLSIDFVALEEGAYEFTLLDSGISDLAGNILDGEPLGSPLDGAPTGDGAPGGDFVMSFQVDAVSVGTLNEFTRLEPLGGLAFASEDNPGILNGPADFDDYLLSLATGEVIAISVTPTDPTATVNVAVVGLSGPVSAPAPGEAAVLPAVAMPIASDVILRVVGDRPTTYRMDVYLNTSLESEVGDTGFGAPLAIDNSWLALPESRYAVLGEATTSSSRSIVYTQDFNLGLGGFFINNDFRDGAGLWGLSTGRQLDGLPNHTAPNSLYFGQNEGPFGGGDYDAGSVVEGIARSPTINLPDTGGAWLSFNHLIQTDRIADIAEVSIVSGGATTPVLMTSDGSLASDTGGEWQPVVADLSAFAGRSIQLQFRFDSIDAIANDFEGWYVDDLQIEAAGDPIADIDEFTLPVVGGVPIDVVLAGQDGVDFSGATLQVIDPITGIVLASGTGAPTGADAGNFDLGILGYTPASDGNIGLRFVSQQQGRYGLVVAAGTVFEVEPNNDAGNSSVRQLSLGGAGLGFLDFDPNQSTRLYAVGSNQSDIFELDPLTGEILNQFAAPSSVSGGADGLAFDGERLFFKGSGSGLYELDPDTGATLGVDSLASLGIPSSVDALASYGGQLVAVDYVGDRLYFIDTEDDAVEATRRVQQPIVGGAAGAGSRGTIFVSDFNADVIREIDAATGAQVNQFPAPGGATYGLAFLNGYVYAGDAFSQQLVQMDADTGEVIATYSTGLSISALAGDDASGTPITTSEPRVVDSQADGSTTQDAYYSPGVPTAVFTAPFAHDPLAKKLGGDLTAVFREVTGTQLASDANTATSGARDLMQFSDGLVLVDAFAEEDAAAVLTLLEDIGMQQGSVYDRTISGWMPIDALEAMANVPGLRFARASYKPLANVGRTTSQADVSMGSDIARSTFGVDGAGVTIGILSDSYGFDVADVRSGDLPGPGNPLGNTTPVNVLADAFGTDEGRAMAQLVHDVAPGAELAFHTAVNGQADFANGILELQSVAGAEVIVDDIIYFAEPMFQDGIIAQAIDTVVANGASYFSSAGNNGRDSWEDAFRGSSEIRFGTELHDFDPGTGVDTLQSIIIPTGATVRFSFQWDSPFFSVSGGAGTQNDVDIYILDSAGNRVVASSTNNNIGGDALEFFSFTNRSGSSSLNIAIGLGSGAAPGLMKWVAFGDVAVNEYATNSATAYGHANAAGAMAIGAADYRDTPAFGAPAPMLESFSSAGGIPTLFDTAGNPINELRSKPNLVAPDGTNTTFFGVDVDGDGFPNFFGTSAAAPHTAAVAGLMKELTPLATPAEIYGALESSAIDMDDPATPGFDVGFDSGTGPGFIDAVGALTYISVDPALLGPRLAAVTPQEGVTTDLSITELTVEFTELLDAATAIDIANYSLIEAGSDGVFDEGEDDTTISLTPMYDGATTVTLTVGDGSTPLRFGNYRLEVGEGISDLDGNPLNALDGPGSGSSTTHEFEVVLQLPNGGDFYELTLGMGQGVLLETSLPGVGPSTPSNALDAQITVYDPFGRLVGTDQDSGDGSNASLGFVAEFDGVYTVQLSAEDGSGSGEYLVRATPAEFMLPMDFNRDGVVNLADYTVFRDRLGSEVAPFEQGDANGDGLTNEHDYQMWRANFGITLATASPNQLVRVMPPELPAANLVAQSVEISQTPDAPTYDTVELVAAPAVASLPRSAPLPTPFDRAPALISEPLAAESPVESPVSNAFDVMSHVAPLQFASVPPTLQRLTFDLALSQSASSAMEQSALLLLGEAVENEDLDLPSASAFELEFAADLKGEADRRATEAIDAAFETLLAQLQGDWLDS